MTDSTRTWLAVGAVCATIAGSTWFQSQRIDEQGQRIDDLRADVTRQIDTLRTDVQREISDLRADVREIRSLLINHLAEHPAEN